MTNYELTRDFCGSIMKLCNNTSTTFVGTPMEESYWKVFYFPKMIHLVAGIESKFGEEEEYQRQMVDEWLQLTNFTVPELNLHGATTIAELLELFIGEGADRETMNQFIDSLVFNMYEVFHNGALSKTIDTLIFDSNTHKFLRESLNPENSSEIRDLMNEAFRLATWRIKYLQEQANR